MAAVRDVLLVGEAFEASHEEDLAARGLAAARVPSAEAAGEAPGGAASEVVVFDGSHTKDPFLDLHRLKKASPGATFLAYLEDADAARLARELRADGVYDLVLAPLGTVPLVQAVRNALANRAMRSKLVARRQAPADPGLVVEPPAEPDPAPATPAPPAPAGDGGALARELEAERDAALRKVRALEAAAEEARLRIGELEGNIQVLKDRQSTDRKDAAGFQGELDEVVREKEDLARRLEETRAERDAARASRAEAEEARKAAEDARLETARQLADAQGERDRALREQREARRTFQEEEVRVEALRSRIEELEREVAAGGEVEEARLAAEARVSELESLVAEKALAEEELGRVAAEREAAWGELTEKGWEIEQLRFRLREVGVDPDSGEVVAGAAAPGAAPDPELRAELERLRTQGTILSQEAEGLRAEIEATRREEERSRTRAEREAELRRAAEETAEAAEVELVALRAQRGKVEGEAQRLRDELEDTTARLHDEIETLQRDLDRARAQVVELDATSSARVGAAEERAASEAARAREATEALDELRREHRTVLESKAELAERLVELERERGAAGDLRADMGRLRRDLEEARDRLVVVERDRDAARADLASVRADLGTTRADLERTRVEKEDYRRRAEGLEKDRAALRDEVHGYRDRELDVESVRKRLAEVEEELAQAGARAEALVGEQEALAAEREEASRAVEEARARIAELEEALAEASATAREQRERIEELDEQLRDGHAQYLEARRQLLEREDQLLGIHGQVEGMERDLAQLGDQLLDLQERLGRSEVRREALESEMDELLATRDQWVAGEPAEELARVRAELAVRTRRVTDLEGTLVATQTRAEEAEAHLARTEATLAASEGQRAEAADRARQSESRASRMEEAAAEARRAVTRLVDFEKELVETLASPLLMFDPQGKITLVNPAGATLFGIPEEEARGRSYRDMPAIEGLGAEIRRGLVGRPVREGFTTLALPGGEARAAFGFCMIEQDGVMRLVLSLGMVAGPGQAA